MAAKWDPEGAWRWQRVIRQLASTLVGVFMLLWQTALTSSPSPLIVGAGLLALGVPHTLRMDERMRQEEEGR